MHVPQARETPGEPSTDFPQSLPEDSGGPSTKRIIPSLVCTSHDSSHELPGAVGATNETPSTQTEGSDVCRDLGDKYAYSAVETTQYYPSASSARRTPEVPWQLLPPPPTDSVAEDERLSTDHLLAGISGDRPSSEFQGMTMQELGKELDQAMVQTSLSATGDEPALYLPRLALYKLINESSVAAVLQNEGMPREESESLARQVCKPSTITLDGRRKKQNQNSTRRKLFATLVMISKVKAIDCFINKGIFDAHLPLQHTRNPDGTSRLSLSARPKEQIECCKDWNRDEATSFDRNQWLFLSPFFADVEHLKDETTKVVHYPLQPKIVPPLEFLNTKADAEAETEVNGGFSTVFRVRFHPDHHSFGLEHERNTVIHALKKLHSPSKAAFNREVEALKRFSYSADHHLIKLLWTYEWRGSFYLVFPCADGNLWDFTKKYADGPELTQTRPREVWVRWLAWQCYGIAAALSRIHGTDTSDPSGSKASGSSANLEPSQKPADAAGGKYGRHGDLKPENILWFSADIKTADCSQTIGVLQISDFGLSDFHGRYSRSNIPAHQFQVCGTYQAPESLISNTLSQSYDIWTLGCVYVQFISWFLLGHAKTKLEFSEKRVEEDDNNVIKGDTFFKVEKTEKGLPVGAVVKKSVQDWIDLLTQHEDCSAFLDEFLRYILSDMLVIRGESRAKCPQVAERLHQMLKRCKTDLSYCLKPDGSPKSPSLSTFMPISIYSPSEREAVIHSLARKSLTFPQEPSPRLTLLRTLTEPEARRPTSHLGHIGSSPPGVLFRPLATFEEQAAAELPMSTNVQQEVRPELDPQRDDANIPGLSVDLPAQTPLTKDSQRQEQASGSAANVEPAGAERDANPEDYNRPEEQERGWGDKLRHLCCCCFG